MATVDASSFARVRIVAPRTRVDVALPNDLTLMDLMPSILDLVGERASDVSEAGWVLTNASGTPLPLEKSLDAADIRDGSVLRVRAGLELVDPPLYDDVVDAIAETVQGRVDRRNPAVGLAAAVAAACLLGSALLMAGAGGPVVSLAAVITSALCLTLSAQAARASRMPQIAVALASVGVVLAFVGGSSLVTTPWSWPRMLLGTAIALVAAVVGRLATGVSSPVFNAWHTLLGLWILGSLAGVVWQHTATQVGACVAIAAVALSSITPWLSVRLARLPVPIVPDSAEDLRRYDPRNEIADAPRRTEQGVDYLHGLTLGCAAGAISGVACSALGGSRWAFGFAIVVFVALLLRTRFIPDAAARTATVALLLVGAGLSLYLLARYGDTPAVWALAALLAVGGLLGALATVTSTRRRISPVTARLIDAAEGLSTVMVLPLGFAVLRLYGYVRGL